MALSFDPEFIEIPTEDLFEITKALRTAAMYIAPPEDWKDWKWPSPEEYAVELSIINRKLMHHMGKALVVDMPYDEEGRRTNESERSGTPDRDCGS